MSQRLPPLKPSKPRPEPVTAEDRVSYLNHRGRLVVFDVPTSCALCTRCLTTRAGLGCLANINAVDPRCHTTRQEK